MAAMDASHKPEAPGGQSLAPCHFWHFGSHRTTLTILAEWCLGNSQEDKKSEIERHPREMSLFPDRTKIRPATKTIAANQNCSQLAAQNSVAIRVCMHMHASKKDTQMSLNSEKQKPLGQGWATNHVEIGGPFETDEERAGRLHRFPGGPLLGWLFDEARRRDEQVSELASALGVTAGFLSQLQNGQRAIAEIGPGLVVACARYLGVPPIVVKLVSGSISMGDFLCPAESEEVTVDRALRQIASDPRLRRAVPADLTALPLDAKRAIVFLSQEYSSVDCLGAQRLPNLVHWMQRAATIHDEAEYLARIGQKGTTSI